MDSLTRDVQAVAPVSTKMAAARSQADDRSTNSHRQLIGWIGLVLPLMLMALAIWRDSWEGWRNLESISAYYYSGAAAAFLGMLAALALFLFTYRGFNNEYGKWDWRLSNWAGIAALVVAFFPTKSPKGVPSLSWWADWVGVVHHVAAIVLFSCFALFALWLFNQTKTKTWRNTLYTTCGVVIVVSMLAAGCCAFIGWPIFWPESTALVAFAWSWLAKGYALKTLTSRGIKDVAKDARSMVW
jgi:hypothetical protein